MHPVADMFRAAASYLEQYGWYQGNYFDWSKHHIGPSSEDGDLRDGFGLPACLMGSLTAAEVVMLEADPAYEDVYGWAESFLQLAVEASGGLSIAAWNDAPDRTMADVIGLLTQEAEKLDPKGALVTEPKPVIDDDDDDDEDDDGVVANELVGVA